MNDLNTEIFRHENYSFRMMTQIHKQQVLKLLSEQFYDQEPLSLSYWTKFPQQYKNFGLDQFRKFWTYLIDGHIRSKMSIIIIDLITNQLIGASIAVDLNIQIANFEQQFMKDINVLSSIISLEEQMIEKIKYGPENFFKSTGTIMDILGVALRKKHMGKRLLHKMMIGNEILAKKQGFQYSFVYATNPKTESALIKQNYQKLDERKSKQYQYLGVKPFQLIEDINHKVSIWIKKLN